VLEEMAAFFEVRLRGYDRHMLQNIDGADAFYTFTATQLPVGDNIHLLDLGCGTGLELERYFEYNQSAVITGIDLSRGMLDALRKKFPNQKLNLIQGSYFDIPFGSGVFDGAVSVESLHHFTAEEKLPLYRKLKEALKPGGYFVLTDYFAESDALEVHYRAEFCRLKKEAGLPEDTFYHYDTPLTVAHEVEVLYIAGFQKVEILNKWGATYTLRADTCAD